MQVGVRVFRHVIIEGNVYSLNVHATTKKIGGNQDPALEILELLVPGKPVGEHKILSYSSMKSANHNPRAPPYEHISEPSWLNTPTHFLLR